MIPDMNKQTILILLLLVATSAGFWACNDKEEHYAEQPAVTGELSLMQEIESNPDWEKFAEILRATGYDKHLSSDAAYTVWIPDKDALKDVDMNDLTSLKRLVTNHIARYTQSASGTNERRIYMLNNKPLTLENRGGEYYLYGVKMQTQNRVAKNGLLHTLQNQLPYRSNLWEYMNDNAGFDSLRNYLYAFDQYYFNPNISPQISYNEEGDIVYDSIFTHSNAMFNIRSGGIGSISTEDSTFTMLLPTNRAWEEAYQRIFPYFTWFVDEATDYTQQRADSLQRENTQYHLVRDLVFRGDLQEILPTFTHGDLDTLYSTTGAAFVNPAHLFAAGTWQEASNGWIFVTDKLDYYNDEAWQRPIIVEAEKMSSYIFTGNSATPPVNGRGRANPVFFPNDSTISNAGYLLVEANSTSDRPYVTFLIPNTLSGKYNLYCVFHPFTTDRDGSEKAGKKAKIRYGIYEWDRIGKQEDDNSWIKIDGSSGNKSNYCTPEWPDAGETLPDSITKMQLRSNFVFPHANAREVRPSIQIRIATYAGNTDLNRNGFRNNMKIDYLILEPVRE
jgi:uncharacterized surface protein with fasciclin (FAS1) repeats